MAIEKMVLMNIIGQQQNLDETLLRCVKSESFHPETVSKTFKMKNSSVKNVSNPYGDLYRKLTDIMNYLKFPETFTAYSSSEEDMSEIESYVQQTYDYLNQANKEKKELKDEIYLQEQTLAQLKHIISLEIPISRVFSSKHIVGKFGRMPLDSKAKLPYFKEDNFFFFPFDEDETYLWGIYMAPSFCQQAIDDIFKSLYFEEITINYKITDTPKNAMQIISETIRKYHTSLQIKETEFYKFQAENEKKVKALYTKIKILHDTFNYRKYATIGHKKFQLMGFVPQKQAVAFMNLFKEMDTVICEQLPDDADSSLKPPVKLKTNRFYRPFEMFVETYGLPGYHDLNPTTYVGLIYTLLFGMMFGDFGQGFCVIIVGALLWKIKKMPLGLILTRCGIFSMFFGFLYGSFFGFEGSFKPVFNFLGLSHIFPLDVLDSHTSLRLLLMSLGIGIFIILCSMIINICMNLKKKDLSKALFSNNGIAGFVLYAGIVTAAILMMGFKINLFHPLFLLIVVLLPLVLIFFSNPLGALLQKKKNTEKFSALDSAFEMIDIILSYCTNTLSFLRVGGFILSHAALMLVVMQFAHMAGDFGNPIVVIIGNIFVMGLEGLLVSIQVLRLLYYETFSRFYESDGKPFAPAKVHFNHAKEK